MNRMHKNTFDKENNHKNINKKGEIQTKRVSLAKQLASQQPIDLTLKNSKDISLLTNSVIEIPNSQLASRQSLAEPPTNTQLYLYCYSQQLLRSSAQKKQAVGKFLTPHDIDNQLRARMLDWLIQVCTSYKFQAKTYFSSIQLMDQYFKKEDCRLPISKLHIIGVTAMLIATKMDEVYPLKINTVYQKIVHRKIEKRQLIDMEARMASKLDFCLNIWSFFDLAILKLHHLYPNCSQQITTQIQLLCEHIARFMVFNQQLLTQYQLETLADSLLYTACEAYKKANKQAYLAENQLKLSNTKCSSCLQQIFATIKTFKTSFSSLKNIFRFANPNVLKQMQYFFQNH